MKYTKQNWIQANRFLLFNYPNLYFEYIESTKCMSKSIQARLCVRYANFSKEKLGNIDQTIKSYYKELIVELANWYGATRICFNEFRGELTSAHIFTQERNGSWLIDYIIKDNKQVDIHFGWSNCLPDNFDAFNLEEL